MNRLLAIGFEPAGHWLLEGEGLTFTLSRHALQRNILYAFASDGDVKYVGKTVQSLYARMGGYKHPAPSQTTNARNKARLIALLRSGAAVDILALPDNGLLHYGQFHVNLAAGLEDSIIRLLNPERNGSSSMPEPAANKSPLPPSSLAERAVSFPLILHPTYFARGFFNVGVDHAAEFGEDAQEIEIFCGASSQPIVGLINRIANGNQTPRIMGGVGLRDWFQDQRREMQEVTVTELSRNAIRIAPIPKDGDLSPAL